MHVAKYRGYEIDGVWFASKDDIDQHIKQMAIIYYKKVVKVFAINMNMEANVVCYKEAQRLVDCLGFTWDEIEAIECEVFESIG